MIAATYASVRREYILVHHEPERRARGVASEVSATSVSWLLETTDVDRSLRQLAAALGPTALYDAYFANDFHPATE